MLWCELGFMYQSNECKMLEWRWTSNDTCSELLLMVTLAYYENVEGKGEVKLYKYRCMISGILNKPLWQVHYLSLDI